MATVSCHTVDPPSAPAAITYHTAAHVTKNATTASGLARWADDEHVPRATLAARPVWSGGELVPFGTIGTFNVDGKPLNPYISTYPNDKWGRHDLGRWGCNHAADPIVTADPVGPNEPMRGILIKRGDCDCWALPGGMVDAGEMHTQALRRELVEEAAEASPLLDRLFTERGTLVYTGIVQDRRNTNNAWIETAAVHVHLTVSEASELTLRPAADGETTASTWMPLTDKVLDGLYANHGELIRIALMKRTLAVRGEWFSVVHVWVLIIVTCLVAAFYLDEMMACASIKECTIHPDLFMGNALMLGTV